MPQSCVELTVPEFPAKFKEFLIPISADNIELTQILKNLYLEFESIINEFSTSLTIRHRIIESLQTFLQSSTLLHGCTISSALYTPRLTKCLVAANMRIRFGSLIVEAREFQDIKEQLIGATCNCGDYDYYRRAELFSNKYRKCVRCMHPHIGSIINNIKVLETSIFSGAVTKYRCQCLTCQSCFESTITDLKNKPNVCAKCSQTLQDLATSPEVLAIFTKAPTTLAEYLGAKLDSITILSYDTKADCYKTQCDCGAEVYFPKWILERQQCYLCCKKCANLRAHIRKFLGRRYGSLKIQGLARVQYFKTGVKRRRVWLCQCDCGRISEQQSYFLKAINERCLSGCICQSSARYLAPDAFPD